MEPQMTLPKYYDLVKLIAQIGAGLGCIVGVIAIFGGIGALKYGFMAGVSAMFGGIITVVLSLGGLGVTYCFLAIVEAQIDTRNALIEFIQSKDN